MAKKVRKDGERKEEKKAVFEPPEFDEREYLTEQLHGIKLNLLFIAIAIPMGYVWAAIAAGTGSSLFGMIACVGVYAGMAYGLQFFLDIEILTGPKRILATTFLMFIFTCLAFSVLMSNPPAIDVTPPSITDVMVATEVNDTGDGWVVFMRHRDTLPRNATNIQRMDDNPDQRLFKVVEGTTVRSGDPLTVLVRAADASGLKGVWLEWGYDNIDSAPIVMKRIDKARWLELHPDVSWEFVGEHYYEAVIPVVRSGSLFFLISVEDNRGLDASFRTKSLSDSILISDEA